jgi:ketol-acid reductoisomerase
MKKVTPELIGKSFSSSNACDNRELIEVNKKIRNHPIEKVGSVLREKMTAMKTIHV